MSSGINVYMPLDVHVGTKVYSVQHLSLPFFLLLLLILHIQLESKCFTQQEQLDTLQEQLETERESAEKKHGAIEKELSLRLDEVHVHVHGIRDGRE